MAVVAISDSILTDIADAIRSKNGTEDTYKPSEMPDAIEAIIGGGITPTGTKQISITENGTTTEDVTNYANAEITVNVPSGGGWTEGETGELIPSSTATVITVPVSKTYTNFAIFVEDSTPNMIKTATRNLVMAKGTYDYIQIMDCNASGSSNSFNRARASNNYITFTSTSITATFLGNGAFASLCAGQAYRWFAW